MFTFETKINKAFEHFLGQLLSYVLCHEILRPRRMQIVFKPEGIPKIIELDRYPCRRF